MTSQGRPHFEVKGGLLELRDGKAGTGEFLDPRDIMNQNPVVVLRLEKVNYEVEHWPNKEEGETVSDFRVRKIS